MTGQNLRQLLLQLKHKGVSVWLLNMFSMIFVIVTCASSAFANQGQFISVVHEKIIKDQVITTVQNDVVARCVIGH